MMPLTFHQKELENLGWIAIGDPTITEEDALLSFSKGDRSWWFPL